MAYTAEEVRDLAHGLEEARVERNASVERILGRKFRVARSEEFAHHGLARRLGTLSRCIENVFRYLPPEETSPPSKDVREDASISLQAFLFGTFGCLDNLAWIWVLERGVCHPSGKPLANRSVGLGPSYKEVWASLTPNLRVYLESRELWFSHLKNFRDALAHRIPPYIPPFTIDPEDAAAYQRLEHEAVASLQAREFDKYKSLLRQRDGLLRFLPAMTHSYGEQSKVGIIHPQMLADFATVNEMVGQFFAELDAA